MKNKVMRCGAEVVALAAIAFAGMAWAQDEVHATEGARKALSAMCLPSCQTIVIRVHADRDDHRER